VVVVLEPGGVGVVVVEPSGALVVVLLVVEPAGAVAELSVAGGVVAAGVEESVVVVDDVLVPVSSAFLLQAPSAKLEAASTAAVAIRLLRRVEDVMNGSLGKIAGEPVQPLPRGVVPENVKEPATSARRQTPRRPVSRPIRPPSAPASPRRRSIPRRRPQA
jgi:hypothetical protein